MTEPEMGSEQPHARLDGALRTQPNGELRRSLAMEEKLDEAWRSGCCAVLDGPGVNDMLITGTGASRRILWYLGGWAATKELTTLVYSLGGGVRQIARPDEPRLDLPARLTQVQETPPTHVVEEVVRFVRGQQRRVLFVIDYIEGMLPSNGPGLLDLGAARMIEQLAELATNLDWLDDGHRTALICRTGGVEPRLLTQPGFLGITVGLPDETERALYLRQMVGNTRRPLYLAPQLDQARAARLSGGLLLDDLSRLRNNASADQPVSAEHIVAAKTTVLRRLAGSTLEILSERLSMEHDVAGVPQLRLLLREARMTGDTSLRIILAGPPGNGKTRAFTALAAELGVPAVRLAQIRAPYVGQAEDNMDRALHAITVMAPCALLIDEADEAGLGHRAASAGEASEVTANLRAKLFGWLGDTGDRLGITVVGTTNRPDRLDPASLSRFKLLPVLHPTAAEAAEIMAIQAKREGRAVDVAAVAAELRRYGAVLSGRVAVDLVGRASVYAARENRRNLTDVDVRQALADLMSTVSQADEQQALLAIAHTTWKPHLPWRAARELGLPVQVPPYVGALLDATGELDLMRLHERLAELEKYVHR
jgi:hypothetical protein